MQPRGLLHGAQLLRFVNFPVPEVLGPDVTEVEIKAMSAARSRRRACRGRMVRQTGPEVS
jgi:hypothetical protein